jgi:hypothetical protein
MKRRDLEKAVEKAGGSITLRPSGHYRIVGPDGVYFTGSTPGDHRARKNLIADLRKLGLDLRGAL